MCDRIFFSKALALKPKYLLKENSNMVIVLKTLLTFPQHVFYKVNSQQVFNICELLHLVCNHVRPSVHKMIKHGLKILR